MKEENNIIEIRRRYKFTQKELKQKLKLKGDLDESGLWSGRSPNDIDKGVSSNTDIYYIETVEKKVDLK